MAYKESKLIIQAEFNTALPQTSLCMNSYDYLIIPHF